MHPAGSAYQQLLLYAMLQCTAPQWQCGYVALSTEALRLLTWKKSAASLSNRAASTSPVASCRCSLIRYTQSSLESSAKNKARAFGRRDDCVEKTRNPSQIDTGKHWTHSVKGCLVHAAQSTRHTPGTCTHLPICVQPDHCYLQHMLYDCWQPLASLSTVKEKCIPVCGKPSCARVWHKSCTSEGRNLRTFTRHLSFRGTPVPA